MQEYLTIAEAIIRHQESIVGPIAWSEAQKVTGIKVNNTQVAVEGDGKNVLQNLVEQYKTLFGQASVEACKDAVRPLLPQMKNIDLPHILL